MAAEDDDFDLRRRLSRARSASRRRAASERRRSAGRRGSGSRSRSRSRSRNRRRSCSPYRARSGSGISGSPSGELYREEKGVDRIATLVRDQQEFLLDLLSEHKAEVEDKLQSRQRKFASKQIEKQYEVNTSFKKLARSVKLALDAKDFRRAEHLVDTLLQQLDTHEEDLVIADTSPHGWLAVAKIRAGTDLPRALRKKLEQVDRDLSAQRAKYGEPGKKIYGVQKESQGPVVRRENRRISPEEALSAAAKQIRPGICSHCKKSYHYYRECPEFWTKVQESREEEAKKPSN